VSRNDAQLGTARTADGHLSSLFHCFLFIALVYPVVYSQAAFAQSKAASVIPAAFNPSSGAFLEQNSASLFVTPISSNDVKVRYIGSDTITKKADSPINFADFAGGFLFKTSRRIGLGIGEILPPVSIQRKIDAIPIVILRQPNLVNLDINANVKYGFSIFGGYLVHDRLSLGAGLAARQIAVKAQAKTESGEKLLDGTFTLSTTNLNIGANYVAIPDKLRIGLTTAVFASTGVATNIDTPLAVGPNSSALNNNKVASNLVFGDLLAGAEFIPNSHTRIYLDLFAKRADKNQKEFSLVDLVPKKKDIHDTASVFVGGRFRAAEKQHALVGYSYEPSAIGPGSPGETGLSGFGMKETALLYSGFGDLFPAWSISVGLQYGPGLKILTDADPTPRKSEHQKGVKTPEKHAKTDIWDRVTFSIGMRYRRASLGVDEAGELPAAYSQTRIQFPVSILSTF